MMCSGVLVPLVTPVDTDGAVVAADIASMIAFLRPGVDALVPTLSTGEGWLLDDRQWADMVAGTVAHAGGLPVYTGALSPTTDGVIERARQAAALGAAAVVATTPYGPDVTQDQMLRHYAELSAASPIPVVVYDEIDRSGNALQIATLQRICQLPGVLAVKDSRGEAEHWQALLAAGLDAVLWLGREELVGAVDPGDGVLLAVANLAPALCQRWWRTRDADLARSIGRLCQAHSLFEPDWYVHVKQALRADGRIAHEHPVPTRVAS